MTTESFAEAPEPMPDSNLPSDFRKVLQVSASYQEVLARLRQGVQGTLPPVFGEFLAEVEELLFDRADSARNLQEQRIFFDAMRTLRIHRETLMEKTLRNYYQSFDALVQNDWSLQLHQELFDNADLKLVENDVLEEMIALDNIVSATVIACGEELDYLTKRLVFLQGQPINDEDNPFIPELFCEGFAVQIRTLDMDREPLQLLYKQFQDKLAGFWPGFVASCNQQLRELGVLPELEKQKKRIVKKTPTESKAAESQPADQVAGENVGQGVSAPAGPRRAEDALSRDQLEMMDFYHSLRAAFGDFAPPEGQSPSPEPVADLVQSLACALTAASEGDVLHTLKEEGLEVGLANLLQHSNKHIEQMPTDQRGVIKVLDQAFRKLNDRHFVPHELSSLVLKLELPVAAMALADDQFLAHTNHPGRRLINEIFKVSTTFLDGADGESDPLRAEVDHLVARMQQMNLSARDLAGLLGEFIDFIEKDKKRLVMREQRLLEEEEALARVSITHGRVYEMFMQLLQGLQAPVFFRKFCEDAWSKVIFLDLLRSAETDNLWLGKMADLQRLKDLVAGEVPGSFQAWQTLRSVVIGHLQGINLEPAAISRWASIFDEYFDCRASASPLPTNPVFELTVLEELNLNLPGIAYLEVVENVVDVNALDSVDALKRGVWVEFKATENSEGLRCRLAGVVSPLAKYVFTNRRGKKVAEETKCRLAQKMKNGVVGVLDNSHLFDGAFEDVVNELRDQVNARNGAQRLH